MQQLGGYPIFFLITIIKFQVAIFIVPQDRVADAGQMDSDLMGFSGDQFYFQHGHIAVIF